MNLKAIFAATGPQSLYALDLPTLNLTVVAPHPDDVDAIGVTLRFFPEHGHDTNSAHRNLYRLVTQALAAQDAERVLLLNRDPKTIAMRTDLYMPFGPAEAHWKAQLLRFHDSQQQRNLHTRAHGFDERILGTNRTAARELGLKDEFAEVFEVEVVPPTNR